MCNKAMEAQCILAEQQFKKKKINKFLDAANGLSRGPAAMHSKEGLMACLTEAALHR